MMRFPALRRATPVTLTVATLVWSAAMAASAATGMVGDGWHDARRVAVVASIFAVGGLIALPVAAWLFARMSGARSLEGRLALALLCVGSATAAATAGVYAIVNLVINVEWTGIGLTRAFAMELVITVLSAFAQFAITGAALFFPGGFLCLLIAAAWFARMAR
jgi:hypothetical protein